MSEVYWDFLEPGNQYLDRVLTGLDQNSTDFGVLPPSFVPTGNLLDDINIKEAVVVMYGVVVNAWKDSKCNVSGLLLNCLASISHHSDWLEECIRRCPVHPFASISLLDRPKLLV